MKLVMQILHELLLLNDINNANFAVSHTKNHDLPIQIMMLYIGMQIANLLKINLIKL